MSVTGVKLDGQWPGSPPKLAWIFSLGETPGRALNIVYKNGRSVSGVIDMPAELRAGAGNKAPVYNNAPNSNPTPSALSLSCNQDIYLGFVLDAKLGATFADVPFSGGYPGAAADYLSVTRVSDTLAYVMVRAGSFGPGQFCKPFNIHLLAKGTNGSGVAYVTPIIIDPDTRQPDGSGPP